MTILYLEDDPNDAALVEAQLRQSWPDARFIVAPTFADFEAALRGPLPDVILADFTVGPVDGLTALRAAKTAAPDTPFILVSGSIGEDRAIEVMRAGAQDYILKDNIKRLPVAVQQAVHVAEERRLHRAARHRLLEQAEMLNQAREAIVITDLAGRVIGWNLGAERMFGWSAVEVIGRPLREVVSPDDVEQIVAAGDAALRDSFWQGELRLHRKDGTELTVESRHTLVRDERGQPRARLAINSDITEKKLLEAQLAHAQHMENIGLLAAGIAHDMNNMLAPILMAAPMLRSGVKDPTALRLLDTVERCAERGAALTRQILSFAQGSGGELKLLQVKHLLRDIVTLAQQTFPRAIRIETDLPSDLFPIEGNPVQIHQVLLNLCVNARDAMPDGGVLRIRAFNRRSPSLPGNPKPLPGAFLVIEVSDSGTGIPPDVLPRIWEPFFTTKAPGQGTGLGLPTVRGIIGNHRGHITVETEVGRGTLFRVLFPAVEDAATKTEVAPTAPRGAGELILVVDDEHHIRELCSTILSRQGYHVVLASDGADAVGWFAKRGHEIRLVVTDLQMPDFDGLALARVLGQINPGLSMLAITGLPTAEEKLRHAPGAIKDVLMKPFTADALARKVHALLHAASSPTSPVSPDRR